VNFDGIIPLWGNAGLLIWSLFIVLSSACTPGIAKRDAIAAIISTWMKDFMWAFPISRGMET
jgi:hypothetical protein